MRLEEQIMLLEKLSGKKVLLEVRVQNPPSSDDDSSFYDFDDIDYKSFNHNTWRNFTVYETGASYFFENSNGLMAICEIEFFEGDPIMGAIEVNPKFRNSGIGVQVYEYFIEKFGGIFSDAILSEGAVGIWKKLSTTYKVEVCDSVLRPVLNVSFTEALNSEEYIFHAINKKTILEVRVRSSNIKDVDYNKDSKDLKIKFMSRPDSTYIFKNVPYDIYEGLMKDKSKGKFFHRKIKNKFGFVMQ